MLWMAIAAAITVRTAREGLPFSLTWWSFTFPVGTVVTGTSGLAARTGLPLFHYAAAALYVFLLLAWGTVFIRTLRGTAHGRLLQPPLRPPSRVDRNACADQACGAKGNPGVDLTVPSRSTNSPSIPESASIQSSAPEPLANAAVARTSASVSDIAVIVTLARWSAARPVCGSTMWWPRSPAPEVAMPPVGQGRDRQDRRSAPRVGDADAPEIR